jgi:Hemerythrin HHE cation binding domain
MITAELPADTRMMGIAHAAFRRDLTRVRQVLTATPVPQGGRRQAVADQVLWLMQALHAHHTAEDAGLWPLVRQRNPAAAQLLDAMEADHRAIVPAMQALTAAARRYRSAGSDGPRLELVRALDLLTGVLEPHLDREVQDAMPVVARALTARDWHAWNHKYNIKPKSPWQLALDGHWLLDEIDPEGFQVVVSQVPAVPRFILLHGFARPYRRLRSAWWSADTPHGHAAAPGRLPGRAGRTGDLPGTTAGGSRA